MSANTNIEWTDRTWSVTRGCSVVSPGCHHCYAMKMAHRFSKPGMPFAKLTKATSSGPQWTGAVRTLPDALLEPLSWKKPQRVFVNSMSDLFHEDVPDAFIDQVFAVMGATPWHTYQVLTKRPERLLAWSRERHEDVIEAFSRLTIRRTANGPRSVAWPLPNVWLGVSVEDQQRADERIPLLLETPAAVRFLSCEPLLGPIDFVLRGARIQGWDEDWHYNVLDGREWASPRDDSPERSQHLDWVIVGGESGPGARPCDVAWIRSIVTQCQAAGVPVFVKQMGSCLTGVNLDGSPYSSPPRREGFLIHWTCREKNTFGLCDRKGGDPAEWPDDLRVRQFPKPFPRTELTESSR